MMQENYSGVKNLADEIVYWVLASNGVQIHRREDQRH